MKKKLLTIVTITYNREKTLERLYNSLLNQTSKNFAWLVVDDGSIDETVRYINSLIKSKNKSFPIRLIQNKNIGKYKEINNVISEINTDLLLFVDSDDYLVNNGVEIIEKKYAKYHHYSIGSMIFEAGNGNAKTPMHRIKYEFIDRRYYYMAKYRTYGDYSDVYITKTLQKFRFPEFKDEKFMSEGPLYYWFSKRYTSVFIPQIMAIKSYENGGLTKNIRKNQINNYKGALYETDLYLGKDTPLLFRIKKAVLYNYIALCSPQKYSKAFSSSNHKLVLAMTIVLSLMLFGIRNIEIGKVTVK